AGFVAAAFVAAALVAATFLAGAFTADLAADLLAAALVARLFGAAAGTSACASETGESSCICLRVISFVTETAPEFFNLSPIRRGRIGLYHQWRANRHPQRHQSRTLAVQPRLFVRRQRGSQPFDRPLAPSPRRQQAGSRPRPTPQQCFHHDRRALRPFRRK